MASSAIPAFVGRNAELSVLTAALEAAAAGRGGMVLVAGEPGIGKTRLAEELAACARRREMRVLWGRCYEGEGAPAFWPWVEILRAALRGLDAASLRAALGPGAVSIAPLVPEVLDLLPDFPDPPLVAPAAARFRLFQAVTTCLANVGGAERGLVLVLDDLHWADTPSLLLLEFLARELANVPVLVVGTYRDGEVRRGDPLARTLGEIARRPQVARLPLAGLSLGEIARVVALTRAGADPSIEADVGALPQDDPLVARVYHDTEGNPLFVQELVRLLAAEGRLEGCGRQATSGRSIGTGSAAPRPVPATVRAVIGRRLDRLSAACLQVLATAAIIGREFGEEVLAPAADVTGEALLAALEEAELAHVIQGVPDTPDRYRFAHALIRETLYEEIPTARRTRLHLRVAEAIEQSGTGASDDSARLAALAGHYRLAGTAAPAGKAVDYAQRAGAAAAAVFAWEEAAAHWQAALDLLQRREGTDDSAGMARRCDLLLALGEALMSAGAPRRVAEEVAPQAFALAEALGDGRRGWQACRMALSALVYYADTFCMTTAEFRRWAEQADRLAVPNTSERVSADVILGYVRSVTGRPMEGRDLKRRALALARTLDDPQARLVAGLHIIGWPEAPGHHAERLRLAREGVTWPRERVNPAHLGDFLFHAGCLLLDWGERAQAEALWREGEDLAGSTRDAILLLHRLRRDMLLALLDGRLHDAVTGGPRLIALADRLGAPVRGRHAAIGATLRPLLHLGRAEEALAAHEAFYQTGAFYQIGDGEAARLRGDYALLLAHMGRTAEAGAILREALRRVVGEGEDATPIHTLTWLLEAAVLVKNQEAAVLLASRLAPLAGLATADITMTCLGRHLGAAAALAGDAETAARCYEQALATALTVRFRPEAALTRLQCAELLAAQPGQATAARQHLEPAIAALEAMQMTPALVRARALAARLGPVEGPAAPASPPAAPRGTAPPYPDGLTAREVEVLRLIAAGLTNKEIAAELVLSPATVRRHSVNLYAKIDVPGRAAATAYAFRHGLAGPPPP